MTAATPPKTRFTFPNDTDIQIERRFNAPRTLVWQVYTQAEHLAQWWGPTGWTVPTCTVDLRVGGEWRYHMRGPIDEQGTMMDSFGLAVYHEVVPVERLVYEDFFADSAWTRNLDLPSSVTTLTFTEEGGATLVKFVTHYATQADRDTVIEMGMEAGITQTLDHAEKLLALRVLDRLVGTWDVTGGAVGEVRYEWLVGEHFLMQHFTLTQDGQQHQGIELIGYEQAFGQPQGDKLKARVYDNHGNTLDYVYDLDGDTLTIWGGDVGSPAYFRGSFNADDTVLDGAWVYPQGGYDSKMTRRG